MNEGFRIEKGSDKQIAKFQDIEMVPGGPVAKDVDTAVEEIRAAHILERGTGTSEGFGEFQAMIYSKGGKWPELEGLPQVIRDAFHRALSAERERNQNADSLACHMGVRVQGNEKAEESKSFKEAAAREGRELGAYDGGLHFDGNHSMFGDLSEYMVTFSGPATIQYLGEADVPIETNGDDLESAIARMPQPNLHPASLLPNHLYHLTHETPHSEPTTLDTHVSDEKPRLFMRIMFAKFDKSMGLSGQVYEA